MSTAVGSRPASFPRFQSSRPPSVMRQGTVDVAPPVRSTGAWRAFLLVVTVGVLAIAFLDAVFSPLVGEEPAMVLSASLVGFGAVMSVYCLPEMRTVVSSPW